MAGRTKQLAGLLISVALILPLIVPACASPQNQTVPGSSDNRGFNLPPMPDPDKGNPKLDPRLQDLILAEKRGEAESFARQLGVGLMDGRVRVQIESLPGKLDATTNATAAVGTVEIIERDFNHVQAVVPISSLTALAEEESIHLIRIPITPALTPSN